VNLPEIGNFKNDNMMKIGDRVKYNRTSEAVILKIEGNYALIQFDSGTKICTNLHGLKSHKNITICQK
jgi:hypothetical protein